MDVVKRDGQIVEFDKSKIENAVIKACIAVNIMLDERDVKSLVDGVVTEVFDRFSDNELMLNVENIHDVVEKHLMRASHFEVAKAYIIFRAEKQRKRAGDRKKASFLKSLTVKKSDGRTVAFSPKKLKDSITRCAEGLSIDTDLVFGETVKNVHDGIHTGDIDKALVLGTTSLIETDPVYSVLAGRIFRQRLSKEVFGCSTERDTEQWQKRYRDSFVTSIQDGVKEKVFDKRLLKYDLLRLASALVLKRDELVKFIGIQTLYERYFAKIDGRRIEMLQSFWMRVAMGLAINEDDPHKRAVEFYDLMSELLYTPSTPTLFHAGLTSPQLSSCYLSCVDDDLKNIFQAFSDNAQMSKWSGGIGNDWTCVRSMGSLIKSTMVESQGVIPFLKIANDTTVAINRSGKRRGATAVYLEVWHLDIEDFIDLRKNTGDERRRTHDINTVAWIPDLFMKRVQEEGKWTLFDPAEAPDLHHIYGKKFEERYLHYEEKAAAGKMHRHKVVEAVKLYRKILTMLFETGHPWLTFKDPCNIRSPQDHVGVIHNSNLCTEITLNTRPTKRNAQDEVEKLGEIAVCNLGSVNLARHMKGKEVDWEQMRKTIHTAMRMLDNVIDINYYPVPEARNSNMLHRPVGLGFMGLQDMLFLKDMLYEEADDFVDELQEFMSYHAIWASSVLAVERGSYESYDGSKWSRGIFPLDTVDLLEKERGQQVEVNRTHRQDWQFLKEHVHNHGMRNSNVMAVAPTATICSIAGVLGPCHEPVFKNLFVKANMSGEFTVVNEYLVEDLKKLNLWNKHMLDQIKYHNGSIQRIEEIPQRLREKYKEVFEIDAKRMIDLTALRAKWIDQSQSHNVFVSHNSGKLLAELYLYAWKKGLKTTYYLRTLGVSGVEKSTLDAKYGLTQKREVTEPEPVKLCKINDPTCESCQ